MQKLIQFSLANEVHRILIKNSWQRLQIRNHSAQHLCSQAYWTNSTLKTKLLWFYEDTCSHFSWEILGVKGRHHNFLGFKYWDRSTCISFSSLNFWRYTLNFHLQVFSTKQPVLILGNTSRIKRTWKINVKSFYWIIMWFIFFSHICVSGDFSILYKPQFLIVLLFFILLLYTETMRRQIPRAVA